MKNSTTDLLVELHVPDFKITKMFYKKLGFKIVREKRPRDRNGYLVMQREKSILCFYCGNEQVYNQSYFKTFSKNTKRGYAVEIAIPVDDIDSFYKEIVKKIGKDNIVKPLETKRWGRKDFRIVDPFGFYLRFSEPYNVLEE